MLELVVVGLLIAILMTVAYRQYMSLVIDAEHAAFNGVRGWLQAGLHMTMSSAVSHDERALLADLDAANPMRLLQKVMSPPSNYLGELSGTAAAQAEPGNWYFDADRKVLYYRFRYPAAMRGFEEAVEARAGFRLKFVQPADGSGINRKAVGLTLLLEVAD